MQLMSKLKKGPCFSLCVIDINSKYAWVIPLKYKKGIAITNAFLKILDESNPKPNKIWVDKCSEFEKNDIEMYSSHNERESVVAERFIRTLKNKIYKYMTSLSKNVYIDKWDDIDNEYNNAYYGTIKVKNKTSTYIESSKKIIIKILNLKLVILLEYQNT